MDEISITLQDKIENILEKYPKTRNSDKELQALLWVKYFNVKVSTDEIGRKVYYVDILKVDVDGKAKVDEKFMDLPLGETVKRHRAFIQNNLKKYLPTSLAVAKKRRIKEEDVREFYGDRGVIY